MYMVKVKIIVWFLPVINPYVSFLYSAHDNFLSSLSLWLSHYLCTSFIM